MLSLYAACQKKFLCQNVSLFSSCTTFQYFQWLILNIHKCIQSNMIWGDQLTAHYHSVVAKPPPVLSDPIKFERFDLNPSCNRTPPTWSRLFYLFHCEFKGFSSKSTNFQKCSIPVWTSYACIAKMVSSVLSCPQEEFWVHTVKLWFTCLSFAAHCSSSPLLLLFLISDFCPHCFEFWQPVIT